MTERNQLRLIFVQAMLIIAVLSFQAVDPQLADKSLKSTKVPFDDSIVVDQTIPIGSGTCSDANPTAKEIMSSGGFMFLLTVELQTGD